MLGCSAQTAHPASSPQAVEADLRQALAAAQEAHAAEVARLQSNEAELLARVSDLSRQVADSQLQAGEAAKAAEAGSAEHAQRLAAALAEVERLQAATTAAKGQLAVSSAAQQQELVALTSRLGEAQAAAQVGANLLRR